MNFFDFLDSKSMIDILVFVHSQNWVSLFQWLKVYIVDLAGIDDISDLRFLDEKAFPCLIP